MRPLPLADTASLPSLDALWMPFTSNRAFKQAPRLLARADGVYYTDVDGRQVLDGVSGLWCVNAGHNRQPIVEAIREAAATLDFAPPFQMGHPTAFALAERLAAWLPGDLNRVFFTNSGSEAVDTALKMALAFHRANGAPERVRFIGRQRGYHGVGFGGISVGGIAANRDPFAAQLLPAVDHLVHTHDPARQAFSRGQPAVGAEFADDLERLVVERGAHTIAAVIVEPVAGSTGVLVPPVGYLDRLRAICDRHGILLIFDEVITGFGRTGASFGAVRFGVQPDLMTLAKGITNGAVPMGAVCAAQRIYDTVVAAAAPGIELFHGYTYSGHPLAAAAGLATLQLYDDEQLFARAAALGPTLEAAVHNVRGAPHVVDVRNIGMVGAIELAPREGAPGARASAVFLECYRRGVLVRQTGETIAIAPPLTITPAQLDEIVGTVRDVLTTVP
ncbi:MAG: aspartate aminotransferase family protein [Gemmatimonadaceae bacterium]|nr:aspartate aminotransferase family protein [Gemmatimonadaceae bacterium]